jgi:dimeric dUTPase (all-alpha-NTP-PPase superfamily)
VDAETVITKEEVLVLVVMGEASISCKNFKFLRSKKGCHAHSIMRKYVFCMLLSLSMQELCPL